MGEQTRAYHAKQEYQIQTRAAGRRVWYYPLYGQSMAIIAVAGDGMQGKTVMPKLHVALSRCHFSSAGCESAANRCTGLPLASHDRRARITNGGRDCVLATANPPLLKVGQI